VKPVWGRGVTSLFVDEIGSGNVEQPAMGGKLEQLPEIRKENKPFKTAHSEDSKWGSQTNDKS
jgi:hypothetical protein